MINEEHTIHFADHEVLLSFDSDYEGIDFRDWWEDHGAAAFKQWQETTDR